MGNDIKPSHLEQLCAVTGIGTPTGVPVPVQGGLLHRMWRLNTTQGIFALKQLNPAFMRKPGIHDIYRLSERIAADCAARGIPAVAAFSPNNDPLVQCGEDTFLVYEWVDGVILTPGLPDSKQARLMGALLARIHALQLSYPEYPPLSWEHFEDEHWDMLTFQAADQSLPWAYPVRAALSKLHEWSRQYEEAGEELLRIQVISHRDLDQKNVIWQDTSTPYPIDWEAAGPVNPTMELVGLAFDWSRQADGGLREDIFTTIIDSYREAGGVMCASADAALHGFMGRQLGWLLFNMRRSLGESITSEEERQLGIHETGATLAELRTTARYLETCRRILKGSGI